MNFLTASVDIKVDDSKVKPALDRTKSLVSRTTDKIQVMFKKMGASFKTVWDKMGRSVKIAGAAIVAGLVLVTKAAMKQEDAQFLLAAALKISGEWTRELQKDFESFAASIQRTTIYGDEEVLSLMQLQKSLGVTASKLKEAAKQAIGLATATGRDIRSMSMYIALAQQGEFTMLRRYIPALRSTTDETEQLRIITEFAAAGFKLAEERAKTTSGALRQMWNALGDVAEKLGMSLLPAIKDLGQNLTEAVQKGGAFQEFIQSQVEGLAALVAGVELLDKKLKEWKAPRETPFGTPVLPPKEWYMEHPEKIGAGIKTMEEAGRIAPPWMYAYKKRAEEQEALMKAAKEFHEIEMSMAEEREKQSIQSALDYLKRIDKEVEASVDASLKRIEAEDAAVKEIDKTWTDMWLKEQEAAYHAMRAPIIAAEKTVRESAERRKRIAEDIALSMASSFSNAIDQMMFEGKKFWDAMEDMARSLIRTITEIIIYKKIAEPLAYRIMGLPVPSAQHGGEVTKTGLAVIHKGETYSGVSERGRITEHRIINQTTRPIEIDSASEYMISDRRIVEVVIRESQTNAGLRRSFTQVRG